jgi:predicted nucleotidyltransferase
MADSTLTTAERSFLVELNRRGVRFMVVGMSGALIQGARGATEDIDLWFEDVTDARIGEAARASGGIWVSGAFGMGPLRLGGDALSERFDVVAHMSGLGDFASEYAFVRFETIDDVRIPVLALHRIVESKRAAARPKDRALMHALEDALALLEGTESDEGGN